MWFHIGPNMHQRERIFIRTMTALSLSLKDLTGSPISLSTPYFANMSIGIFDNALHIIAKQRADLGAYFNRLEHTAKGLMNAYENIQSAESRIRDADMAEVTVDLSKNQILVQSGTSMLVHANMRPQGVLQLLQ